MNKNLFENYLKFFLIGCSVFYIPGDQFYAAQEMFFQYGVMGMVALSFLTPKVREINNKWLALILGYALINTIIFHFSPEIRMKLLNMFLGFVLIKEVSERVNLDFKEIGNILALFCAFNVAWIGLQINNIDPVFQSVFKENMPQVDTVGFMGLKANLGVLAALSFPFIFQSKPFNSIVCLPLLWFGRSSTSVLAVVFSLLFMLWFKNRKLFWYSVLIVISLGLFYVLKIDMPSGQFGKRFNVWGAGINFLAGSSPWFGNGMGSWGLARFTTLQENGQPQVWLWAHSEFIQYFFELGLFGLFFMYGYFKGIFKKINLSLNNHRLAVMILMSLIFISAFHFPFRIGRFAGLSCFMLACIEALLTDKEYA